VSAAGGTGGVRAGSARPHGGAGGTLALGSRGLPAYPALAPWLAPPPHPLSPASPPSPTHPAPARRNTEHDPPYWRGQIWVNVNYLALRALHHYAHAAGPHTAAAGAAYSELRGALLRTLVGQYRRTGYLWEQYDDDSGAGLSSHPFTGWTALLTLVAAEAYG
jgi:hypothetical protein